jgi:hypothetical protein
LQIVKAWRPFERRAGTVAGCNYVYRIALAATDELDLKIDTGDALHGLDYF